VFVTFQNGVTLDFIAQKVAEFYEISPSELRKRSRLTKAASARKAFAYACREFLGYPVKVIGNYLGMTGPSASTCIKNGEPLAKTQEMANLFLNLRP
jgi:chromosomal replication initiation ATPase DnaA